MPKPKSEPPENIRDVPSGAITLMRVSLPQEDPKCWTEKSKKIVSTVPGPTFSVRVTVTEAGTSTPPTSMVPRTWARNGDADRATISINATQAAKCASGRVRTPCKAGPLVTSPGCDPAAPGRGKRSCTGLFMLVIQKTDSMSRRITATFSSPSGLKVKPIVSKRSFSPPGCSGWCRN